jgi:pilus assembly protein CpaC
VIDALAQDSLVHMLAEPNLTVMSGQRASFQVGGEFPIPIAQMAGAISVDFKSYGVSLAFVPTVYSDGRINLHVMPEVSQISTQNSVSVTTSGSTLVIPSLTVRRAESTVELGSGETFAIAGLLQDTSSDQTSGLPGLGEVPGLGALFRTDNFNRLEDELVILVTPYVSRPVTQTASMSGPDDKYVPPTEAERLFLMRQVDHGQRESPTRIPGSAGFMVQ